MARRYRDPGGHGPALPWPRAGMARRYRDPGGNDPALRRCCRTRIPV